MPRGKMIRSDLYRLAARQADLPVADVASAVDAFLEVVKEALQRGHRVELRRFGSFWARRWAGRAVRPPGKAKSLKVTGARTVSFRAGEELRAIRG